MYVVCESPGWPALPTRVPTTWRSTHGMDPGATMEESFTLTRARAHTALLSRELCHVTRAVLSSFGLGLRKCVVTCAWTSRPKKGSLMNSVACGRRNVQLMPFADGMQM